MIDLFVLIGFSCFIAQYINKLDINQRVTKSEKFTHSILLWIIIVVVSLFAGLRTSYNDTSAYMHAFDMIENSDLNINLLLQPYGGFEFLQVFIKTYISSNPQYLLLIVSFLVNITFISFFARYSKNFSLTIFCYFILGPYIFSMAGLKQVIAMAISLYAIEGIIKNNNLKFVVFILIASLFHPYIICLLILPLLKNNIWDSKVICLMLLLIIVVVNLDTLISIASLIGKDYSLDEFVSNTINPIRVVIEMIPVCFSFVGRKLIRKENDSLLNLGVNMMCINGLMIFMGLFFNPVYLGRIGTYFSSIIAMTMPRMLDVLYEFNQNKTMNKVILYSLFFVYFVLDMTKLGRISIFTDLFKHVSLSSLF